MFWCECRQGERAYNGGAAPEPDKGADKVVAACAGDRGPPVQDLAGATNSTAGHRRQDHIDAGS